MHIFQGLIFLVVLLGFLSASSKSNLLQNICFTFASCHSSGSYLQLTPPKFDSNIYNYTVRISPNYPFYTSAGPMNVEFYVIMNASDTVDLSNEKRSVAKSVLYDASGKQELAVSELAYFPNELIRLSVLLWQPGNKVTMFDNDSQMMTKLIVYQFIDNKIQQSDPYTLIFKRNE